MIKTINVIEWTKKLEKNKEAIILDVRTLSEFNSEKVKNAINIDFYLDNFQSKIDELDKDKTYLIYCRSGGRSGNTLKLMKRLNFKEVYDLEGGVIALHELGFSFI